MFALSIVFAVLALAALIVGFVLPRERKNYRGDAVSMAAPKKYLKYGGLAGAVFCTLFFTLSMVITVSPGHMAVGTLFGEVYPEARPEGLHFVNPLSQWREFDCRQKKNAQQAMVPSKDQLRTQLNVTIKYRLIKAKTPEMFANTGDAKALVEVHLVPETRSLLREIGKSVVTAEEFYSQEVQQRLQEELQVGLVKALAPKGILVQDVLVSDIVLPKEIEQGVKNKKVRDQEAEREKAELRRFETEQQKKVKSAEAEKQAADLEAQKIKVLADAKAYEIKKINAAISSNPAYIKLEALKSLQSMSKDPAAKLYFMNGDGNKVLPLMHLDTR
jgi:regulator of protease activity HflC (stomatin/prohibitin superfamily)